MTMPDYAKALVRLGAAALLMVACEESSVGPAAVVELPRRFDHAIVVSGDHSATLAGWGEANVDRYQGVVLEDGQPLVRTLVAFHGPRSAGDPSSPRPLDATGTSLLLEVYGPFEPGTYLPRLLSEPLMAGKRFSAVFSYRDPDGNWRVYPITAGEFVIEATTNGGGLTATFSGESQLGYVYIRQPDGTTVPNAIEQPNLEIQATLAGVK